MHTQIEKILKDLKEEWMWKMDYEVKSINENKVEFKTTVHATPFDENDPVPDGIARFSTIKAKVTNIGNDEYLLKGEFINKIDPDNSYEHSIENLDLTPENSKFKFKTKNLKKAINNLY
jgi:hypothetical protein